MARFRKVIKMAITKNWAYVETTTEGGWIKLGGMEFKTEAEAKAYSRGFGFDSYEYKEPK